MDKLDKRIEKLRTKRIKLEGKLKDVSYQLEQELRRVKLP